MNLMVQYGLQGKEETRVFTNVRNCQYLHYCQLCIVIYLQFPSFFATNDSQLNVSKTNIIKYENRYQWI